MIRGELDEADDGNGYEGISDDGQWYIHVDYGVLPEAYHLLTMRGYSRTHQSKMLFDTEIWLTDRTLRALDGVTIRKVTDKEGNKDDEAGI